MNESAAAVVEETEVDEIYAAFTDGVDQGKEGDDLKMIMIGAGATFKNVTRLFNQYMIDAGLAMSKEEKDDIVLKIITESTIDTEDGFNSAVESIVSDSTGITEQSAASLIRHWAKKNEVNAYKKVVVPGATRNPFVKNFHAALVENPSMEEQGLREIIAALEPEQQSNPNRWFQQHNNIRKLANSIAAKFA